MKKEEKSNAITADTHGQHIQMHKTQHVLAVD